MSTPASISPDAANGTAALPAPTPQHTAVGSKVKSRIGQQMLAAGLITEVQLEAALESQRAHGGFIGDALVRMGFARAELVGQMLSASMNVPYVHLVGTFLDPQAFDLVPEDYQRQHSLLPYKIDGEAIVVAMSDPLNVRVIDHLQLLTGMKVTPMLALHEDIQEAFNRAYTVKHAAESVLRDLEESDPAGLDQELSEDQLAGMAENAPIIRLVNSMIVGAVNSAASDIHIEPQEKRVRVRYRIDGMLYEQMSYAPHLHPAVVSRIKIMAHLNIAERRRSQDGRINFNLEGTVYDLRVSTMQMANGEKVVLRILDKSGLAVSLEKLGFLPEQLDAWNGFLGRPHGMVLVTGPTGSGKSTTLYASLAKINDTSRNIITVEDPIEYNLAGVNQSQVNSKIGVDFATGMRTIVRQDPDIILVGEIRDRETAEIAIQAALTGHLVFSTLHTNDAPGALVRLENMGVERFLITSAIIGVIGQRLLRRVCAACAEAETPEQGLLSEVGITAEQAKGATFKRGKGCTKCAGRGYRGRVAVYEVMPITSRLREALRKNTDGGSLKEIAVAEGMITMRESGLRRALAGETTLEEVARVLATDEG